jgi:senataxin
MVGDPHQLPATVFSRDAKDRGNYKQSLFTRLQKSGYPIILLDEQYRMHPEIAKFPSRHFYNNQLKTSSTVNYRTHHRSFHDDANGMFRPFLFHDIVDGRERADGHGSFSNIEEVSYILQLYQTLRKKYPKDAKSIGIIASYKSQRTALKQAFKGLNDDDIEISTVDSFQVIK